MNIPTDLEILNKRAQSSFIVLRFSSDYLPIIMRASEEE